MSIIAEWNFESEDGVSFVDVAGTHTLVKGGFGSWIANGKQGYAVRGATDLSQSQWGAGAYGPFPGGSRDEGAFSIAFWARMDDTSQGGVLVSALNSNGKEDPWAVYIELDGSIQLSWYDATGAASPTSSSATPGALAEGVWTYIAAVWNPGVGATVYANGVVVTQYGWQSGTSGFYPTWETLLVGSSRWGSRGAYIDELRLSNEALTKAQILSYMNTPVGAPFGNRIRLGGSTAKRMYVGETPVVRVYLGNTLLK
jgi:hypothetical protein